MVGRSLQEKFGFESRTFSRYIMPITVSIAQIQILQNDAVMVRGFVDGQPGKNKEAEDAAHRMEEFARKLMGMDVQIRI